MVGRADQRSLDAVTAGNVMRWGSPPGRVFVSASCPQPDRAGVTKPEPDCDDWRSKTARVRPGAASRSRARRRSSGAACQRVVRGSFRTSARPRVFRRLRTDPRPAPSSGPTEPISRRRVRVAAVDRLAMLDLENPVGVSYVRLLRPAHPSDEGHDLSGILHVATALVLRSISSLALDAAFPPSSSSASYAGTRTRSSSTRIRREGGSSAGSTLLMRPASGSSVR